MAEIATKEEMEKLLNDKLKQFADQIIQSLNGPNLNGRKWLKVSELKKIVPLSDYRISELRIQGKLAYQKMGGTFYYTVESVNQLVNATGRR
jgi:hypothetical protein